MECLLEECGSKRYAKGYCNKHYKRWHRYGDPNFAKQKKDGTLEDRLHNIGWDVTETGCWEWKGARYPSGHGCLSYSGEVISTHRAAHEVWIGPVPPNKVVRHYVCDNPPCINPEHLRAGTQKDNMDDMVRKGRGNGRNGSSGNGLTLQDKQHIFAGRGLVTYDALAELYGISDTRVYNVMQEGLREGWGDGDD